MAALTGRRASLAVGYAFAATMFGTTLPTPLYPLYRATLGFGQLSDRIDRRPGLQTTGIVTCAVVGALALATLLSLLRPGAA